MTTWTYPINCDGCPLLHKSTNNQASIVCGIEPYIKYNDSVLSCSSKCPHPVIVTDVLQKDDRYYSDCTNCPIKHPTLNTCGLGYLIHADGSSTNCRLIYITLPIENSSNTPSTPIFRPPSVERHCKKTPIIKYHHCHECVLGRWHTDVNNKTSMCCRFGDVIYVGGPLQYISKGCILKEVIFQDTINKPRELTAQEVESLPKEIR